MKKELQEELEAVVKEMNQKTLVLNKKYITGFLDGYKQAIDNHLKELDPEAIPIEAGK